MSALPACHTRLIEIHRLIEDAETLLGAPWGPIYIAARLAARAPAAPPLRCDGYLRLLSRDIHAPFAPMAGAAAEPPQLGLPERRALDALADSASFAADHVRIWLFVSLVARAGLTRPCLAFFETIYDSAREAPAA